MCAAAGGGRSAIDDDGGASTESQGIIEIDLGSGHRIRVDGEVDGDALRRVLDALVRR